jgi:hypothetical protein
LSVLPPMRSTPASKPPINPRTTSPRRRVSCRPCTSRCGRALPQSPSFPRLGWQSLR